MFQLGYVIGSDVASVEHDADGERFDFERVSAWRYLAHRREACSRPLMLSPETADTLDASGARCYLARSGIAGYFLAVGFFVRPDGELAGLFNGSGVRGLGVAAFRAAEGLGARWLTCYAGHLDALYRSLGWRETGREAFAEAFAPDGWRVERDGRPDYVTMRGPFAGEGPGEGLRWRIRDGSETGEPLYWSNANGWGDAASADTWAEQSGALPIGGTWERVETMPEGWAPEGPDTLAAEALDAWAEAREANARSCEIVADAGQGDAEALRGEAAGGRAFAHYARALGDVLGDVLAAPALREAAEALESAAASLDGAAGLLADAEGEHAGPTYYAQRARDAAADALAARTAAQTLRQRAEAAEAAERSAARRAWEISN